MMYVIFFMLELLVLFSLSNMLSKAFSRLLLRMTGSTQITINIMSFFFLPGVILHELAHWFVAGMFLVRTGEMEFMPQVQGDTVKLGSVAIAHTDPFRRFLIGVAPILIGLSAMFGLFAYFSPYIPSLNWQTAVVIYLFFEIGNTMFSSKKDMEGAVFLLGFLIFIGILLYIIGIRVDFSTLESFFSQPVPTSFLKKADTMLLFPIGINTILCLPTVWRRGLVTRIKAFR